MVYATKMSSTSILSATWILILNFMVVELATGQYAGHADEDLTADLTLLHRARQHFPLRPKGIISDIEPEDCEDVLMSQNHRGSGVYKIWPRANQGKSMDVYCDMNTDQGGWTVFQRRGNYGRAKEYFFQGWDAYKKGFGDLEKDFWLGNDNIFALTSQKEYTIRFDFFDWEDNYAYAAYDSFRIESEQKNYRMNVSGYNGTAGDSFTYQSNQQFSTKDRDNDALSNYDCADRMNGAWWYNGCHRSNLNGLYYQNGAYRVTRSYDGVDWSAWKGYSYSLRDTEMKIRSKGFLSRRSY